MSGVAATSSRNGLGGMLHDVGHLFQAPHPMPTVAQRANAILAQIHAADGPVVLWVPGTSEHEVPEGFRRRVQSRMPGVRVILLDYQAIWRFHDSVPDGDAVLATVLAELAREGSTRRVLLAGESQGTWVISNTLANPGLAAPVLGAALLAHPGVADDHAPGPTLPRSVKEFNASNDLVSRAMRDDRERRRVITMIDNFARLHLLRALGGIAAIVATDPALVGGLIGSQLFRFKSGAVDPHNTEDRWTAAVEHLARMAGL